MSTIIDDLKKMIIWALFSLLLNGKKKFLNCIYLEIIKRIYEKGISFFKWFKMVFFYF